MYSLSRPFIVIAYNSSVQYSRVTSPMGFYSNVLYKRGTTSLVLAGFLSAVLLHAPTINVAKTLPNHRLRYFIPAVTVLFGIFPCFETGMSMFRHSNHGRSIMVHYTGIDHDRCFLVS